MSYFESDGGGDNTPKLTEDTVILTKNNIPMRFESGYYNEFTVTTDPTLLKAKTIKYKHHQHSASNANATYEDEYTDARGAKSVGEWSATGGGCYTQRVKRGGLRILEQHMEEVDRSGGAGTAIDRFMNSHWKCTFCGQEMEFQDRTITNKWGKIDPEGNYVNERFVCLNKACKHQATADFRVQAKRV